MLKEIKTTILKLLQPIQKLLQWLSKKEPLMTYAQAIDIMSTCREGDILLSRESQRATSIFIKGYYKHAAIISSKMTVIEAVGTGVREVELFEWLLDKDSVCLIRPVYESDMICKLAAANSLSYIGKPYDYSFSLVDERVYCSELVYLCYAKEDKNFLAEIDHDDILPNEFYDLCFKDSNLHFIKQYKNI